MIVHDQENQLLLCKDLVNGERNDKRYSLRHHLLPLLSNGASLENVPALSNHPIDF